MHLRKVVSNMKLIYEEMATVHTQIEACPNSRPLSAMMQEDDSVEALTQSHFLIGRPIKALPDSSQSFGPISLLHRWHLCQALTCHFWQRWSKEYLVSLRRFSKSGACLGGAQGA